jgi:SAM-dependent methyltransferase
MALQYVKDADGEDLLTDDSGEQQVMMEWEKPYMIHLVHKLQPVGSVLEIGFGMGYSADAIHTHNISSYTVIEPDPVVLEKAQSWTVDKEVSIRVLEGVWQKVLPLQGEFFDFAFFDDYPSEEYPDPFNQRIFLFIEYLLNNIEQTLKLVWFCTDPNKIEEGLDVVRNRNPGWDMQLECTPFNLGPSSSINTRGYYNPKDMLDSKELWAPVLTITRNVP